MWVVRTFDKDDLPLSQGSAVVIGAETLVTNCHVLRKGKRVEVTHAKASWPATLELWDTARDLCQLRRPACRPRPWRSPTTAPSSSASRSTRSAPRRTGAHVERRPRLRRFGTTTPAA